MFSKNIKIDGFQTRALKIYPCVIKPAFILWFLFNSAGCAKFVSVAPPKTQLTSSNVFDNPGSANAAVIGIYSRMSGSSGFASGGNSSVTVLAGLSSDELINYQAGPADEFYHNAILPNNTDLGFSLWNEMYQYVYTANSILEGLSKTENITKETKDQLTGEARFVRAFCYFYLSGLFGSVPLDTTSDYRNTAQQVRSLRTDIWAQIIRDLKISENLLPDEYINAERVRPNKSAASALMARVYLYAGDWADAEAESSKLINNTQLYDLESDLDKVFLKNSRESIWQLYPVLPGINTQEGSLFILAGTPTAVSLSNQTVNAFEAGDLRRVNWTDSIIIGSDVFYFPTKYKINFGSSLEEYSTILRLSEQYLIRAEARAEQDDLAGAAGDLNTIRNRAGLGNTLANDKEALLSAVQRERRVELFTEWGHRWLDLIRNGEADNVLGVLKGPDWQATDTLYPIPLTEIQNNPRITQNAGY